jgi:hypothetical protein
LDVSATGGSRQFDGDFYFSISVLILFGERELDGARRVTAADHHVVGVVFTILGKRPDIVKLPAVRHGGIVNSGPPLRPGCNSVMTITLPSSASLRVIVGVPGSLFQVPTKPCGPCAKTGKAIARKIAEYISRFMGALLDCGYFREILYQPLALGSNR